MNNLISVQDLRVAFRMGKTRTVEAVKGVSFDIPVNSTVALVGESGSGKSVSAMSIVRLLPENAILGAQQQNPVQRQRSAASARLKNCAHCAAGIFRWCSRNP
jgi:ABC-type dipeptide/oligopeptide/nickel transport system ATPase component